MIARCLAWFALSGLVVGCLDRPIGESGPRTTSVISKRFKQAAPAKLDLLLVVDNSASMGDKQQVLARAIPDLIESLTLPACVGTGTARIQRHAGDGECPEGTVPEFRALEDIQVGVITTSLGSFGGGDCETEEQSDMAHLLPTRPRAQHIPSDNGIIKWQAGEPLAGFIDTLRQLVPLATDVGCGKEAPLEAWYRFLIDPAPYTSLERVDCDATGTSTCARAATGTDGARLVDTVVLEQRARFLRPDSLVAIAMLTDENDCSYRETRYSTLLTTTTVGGKYVRAPSPSAACATDPNDKCCHSCSFQAPEGCPKEPGSDVLGAGCGVGLSEAADPINLRCFDQKRRFGIDMLNPVERYIHALTERQLCVTSPSLDVAGCDPQALMNNPLFVPGGGIGDRDPENVFLVGLVGVPWQDIAVSADPSVNLEYLPASAEMGPAIRWDWITPGADGSPAVDPLMRSSITPRSGQNPATGESLAAPNASYLANSINGHEWFNTEGIDLQYACIFPLPEPLDCNAADVPEVCDCSDFGLSENRPLCQNSAGSYQVQQLAAKAYPGTRELQVLQGVGSKAVVASICAKEMQDTLAPDYGYRAAMAAVVDRIKGRLQDLCFDRKLSLRENNTALCRVVEVIPNQTTCDCAGVRSAPDAALMTSVERQMDAQGLCDGPLGCDADCACEIKQIEPLPGETTSACQVNAAPYGVGDGWCYIDEAAGVGAELVKDCAPTERQKVRFVGEGVTRDGSYTFLSCLGSAFDEAE